MGSQMVGCCTAEPSYKRENAETTRAMFPDYNHTAQFIEYENKQSSGWRYGGPLLLKEEDANDRTADSQILNDNPHLYVNSNSLANF